MISELRNLAFKIFPAFSSQQSQDAPVETPVQTPAARIVRRKWNPADDEVLISAWLNTSKDAIVANEQKKRWHRINEDVNKFCAAYSAAERQMSSGETDTDVLKKAHDIFFSDQEHKFTLEHAWWVLRYEHK
uniref:Myb-like domain-containing protein n=1 Tax=Brassica oleracea var. oleracea TaxID=109376 RepID=A0A0D3EAW8_BRAOL